MRTQIVAVFVVLMIVLAACSSGGGGGAQPAQPVPAGPTIPPDAKVIVVTATATPQAAVPDDIAIMPGATDLNVSEAEISYVIKSDLNGVIAFYQKEMIAKGWKEQEKPSIIGDFGRMYFSGEGKQVSLLLNASPSLNQVIIRMSVITLNVFDSTPTPKP